MGITEFPWIVWIFCMKLIWILSKWTSICEGHEDYGTGYCHYHTAPRKTFSITIWTATSLECSSALLPLGLQFYMTWQIWKIWKPAASELKTSFFRVAPSSQPTGAPWATDSSEILNRPATPVRKIDCNCLCHWMIWYGHHDHGHICKNHQKLQTAMHIATSQFCAPFSSALRNRRPVGDHSRHAGYTFINEISYQPESMTVRFTEPTKLAIPSVFSAFCSSTLRWKAHLKRPRGFITPQMPSVAEVSSSRWERKRQEGEQENKSGIWTFDLINVLEICVSVLQ